MKKFASEPCPECGGKMKIIIVQPGKKMPQANSWRRKIQRYECIDKNCGHIETPNNSDREADINDGLHDNEIGIINDNIE